MFVLISPSSGAMLATDDVDVHVDVK